MSDLTTDATPGRLSVAEIDALTGRDLDIAVAKALGWSVRQEYPDCEQNFAVFNHDGKRYASCIVSREGAWKAVPSLSCSLYSKQILVEGVERFGGVSLGADMEEWANGGLFQCGFMGHRMTWFLPYEQAICRAFLYAAHGHRNDAEPTEQEPATK